MPIIWGAEWQFSSFFAPKSWKLVYEGRTVAELHLKSRLRWDFEGQFDEIPVKAEYRSREDRTTIINISNNEIIGIIDNMSLLKSNFTLKDGSVYILELKRKIGYVLSDKEGKTYGSTNIINKTPISVKSTLFKDDRRLFNPWFIALITFYYALVHGIGTTAA